MTLLENPLALRAAPFSKGGFSDSPLFLRGDREDFRVLDQEQKRFPTVSLYVRAECANLLPPGLAVLPRATVFYAVRRGNCAGAKNHCSFGTTLGCSGSLS
jgi:hypothetical protein